MVILLHLISGILISTVCTATQAEATASPADPNATTNLGATTEPLAIRYNTLTSLKLKKITDEEVENIVKPFKFAREDGRNVTSLKLKKSEPYVSTELPNNRTNAGRSVDLDVDTPVDHNAVYTSPDNSEYTKEEESRSSPHSTEEASSYENLERLTTPKTPFFDRKFQQTVDSINKNIDDIPDTSFENTSSSKNYSSDNYIEPLGEVAEDSKFKYDSFETPVKSSQPFGRKTLERVEERRTTLNYVNKYNTTISYDKTSNEESNELHKGTKGHLIKDDSINEVKQNKSTGSSILKNISPPPLSKSSESNAEKSDPSLISNKIEGEATTPTSSISTIKPSRGSVKFADYNKVNLKTASSSVSDKPSEQTVEENQVVPILVTAPNKEITSTPNLHTASITTVKTKSIVLSDGTTEPDAKQSTTVYIFGQPEDMKDFTTIRNEIEEVQRTSVASTPRAFEPSFTTPTATTSEASVVSQKDEEITTFSDSFEDSTAVTSLPRGFSLPTTTTESVTEESTTVIPNQYEESSEQDIFNVSTIQTTTSDETTSKISEETTTLRETQADNLEETSFSPITETVLAESTTVVSETTTVLPETTSVQTEPSTVLPEPLETTTISSVTTTAPAETTTDLSESTEPNLEVSTTVTDLRSSKNMKFLETTEMYTTESSETTTFNRESSSPHTSSEIPTVPEDITTISPTVTETTTKGATPELNTKINMHTTPTKTLLDNKTSEVKSGQEIRITPTTSFDFVHIQTIDKNHTTLTPDELKPNEIYTTPAPPESSEKIVTTDTPSDETTSSGLDGPSGGSGTVVAIIISCVGGVCLIALAYLLIVMRNRQNRFNYGQRCRPVSLDDYSVDNVSVFNSVRRKTAIRGSKTSYGNPAFEDPVCLSHPLNFPAISKFASNEEDLAAEFKDIPQIIARTSELPEGCETKNRYANVIPLPESRVPLKYIDGYPNSDYINANFVTGPKNIRKYYIACQAPMSNTVDDFWRMIWEQQCKVILMVTNLYEGGIEKCFDYLPPSEVLDCHRLFGDYQVTLKKREVKEKYIISSIQLKNMVSNSWREVTHFWYMGWPERGVPAEANSIIAFLIEARSYMKSTTIDKKVIKEGDMNGNPEVNPVVVHCSPGTGRTGAVITCDIAIRDFEQTRQVDIPKVVYKIRRDRAGAVQTKEQYAFIYKVIDFYATKLAGGNLESI